MTSWSENELVRLLQTTPPNMLKTVIPPDILLRNTYSSKTVKFLLKSMHGNLDLFNHQILVKYSKDSESIYQLIKYNVNIFNVNLLDDIIKNVGNFDPIAIKLLILNGIPINKDAYFGIAKYGMRMAYIIDVIALTLMYNTHTKEYLRGADLARFNKYNSGNIPRLWSYLYEELTEYWKSRKPLIPIASDVLKSNRPINEIYPIIKKSIGNLLDTDELKKYLVSRPRNEITEFIIEALNGVHNSKFYLAIQAMNYGKYNPNELIRCDYHIQFIIDKSMELYGICSYRKLIYDNISLVEYFDYMLNEFLSSLNKRPKCILDILQHTNNLYKLIQSMDIDIYVQWGISVNELKEKNANFNINTIYALDPNNNAERIRVDVAILMYKYFRDMRNANITIFRDFSFINPYLIHGYYYNILNLIDDGNILIDDMNLWDVLIQLTTNPMNTVDYIILPFLWRLYQKQGNNMFYNRPALKIPLRAYIILLSTNNVGCLNSQNISDNLNGLIKHKLSVKEFMKNCVLADVTVNSSAEELKLAIGDMYIRNKITTAELQKYIKNGERVGTPSTFGQVYEIEIDKTPYIVKVHNKAPKACTIKINNAIGKSVLTCDNGMAEAFIGVLLYNLIYRYTTGIINVFGFFTDDNNIYQMTEQLIPFQPYNYNDDLLLLYLFSISRTLYIAFIMARYTHYDLHYNNVMLRMKSGFGYYYKNKYITPIGNLMPVIIDHGFSTMETNTTVINPDYHKIANPYVDIMTLIHTLPTGNLVSELKTMNPMSHPIMHGLIKRPDIDRTRKLNLNGARTDAMSSKDIMDYCFDKIIKTVSKHYSITSEPQNGISYYRLPDSRITLPDVITHNLPTIPEMPITVQNKFTLVELNSSEYEFKVHCCHMDIVEYLSNPRIGAGFALNINIHKNGSPVILRHGKLVMNDIGNDQVLFKGGMELPLIWDFIITVDINNKVNYSALLLAETFTNGMVIVIVKNSTFNEMVQYLKTLETRNAILLADGYIRYGFKQNNTIYLPDPTVLTTHHEHDLLAFVKV